MDNITLQALKQSIQKWEKIVAREGVDQGCKNCPLCELFNQRPNYCAGCPVYERTGVDSCSNTPYTTWCKVTYDTSVSVGDKITGNYSINNINDSPESQKAAEAELAFLKSLLPGNNNNET